MLHLASAPITISDDGKSITFLLSNGTTLSQKFRPTPKANCDWLCLELTKLLRSSKASPTQMTFGTPAWHLDPEGDAIHRHIGLQSATQASEIKQLIEAQAEILNHTPHVIKAVKNWQTHCMTITCTTHNPRGLSTKDTRLALLIDGILLKYGYGGLWQADSMQDEKSIEADIQRERLRLIAINRDKSNTALARHSGSGVRTQKHSKPTVGETSEKQPQIDTSIGEELAYSKDLQGDDGRSTRIRKVLIEQNLDAFPSKSRQQDTQHDKL